MKAGNSRKCCNKKLIIWQILLNKKKEKNLDIYMGIL